MERVVVVGAGMAGLAAANALTHAGVECIVLEARDRIGGRLHTVDVAGVPVDMGGSWIHTPVGNPMRRYADQSGVACRDGSIFESVSGYDRLERRPLLDDELADLLETSFERFPLALDDLRTELGPDAAAAAAVDRFVAVANMEGGQSRRVRDALRTYISATAADIPERQSLRWLFVEEEYEGDALGDMPVGGYVRLVEAMGARLPIRCSAEVIAIEFDDAGVRVTTVDGSAEEGSHVLCTLPLGVLKNGAVRFLPELPGERRAAIDRLGFGRFEKIALGFDEPFWRSTSPGHLLIFAKEPDAPMLVVLNQDAFGVGPAVVALVYHADTGQVTGRPSIAAAQWLIERLEDALGRPCPAPTSVVTSSWGDDPYALGAYAHYPPGAGPEDTDELARPLGGRLMFAGEATSRTRMGYADGAMQTGIREAKRLLGQPAVALASWQSRSTPA